MGIGLGFCCCGPSCVYYTDAFGRADSTDLGADWTEVAGSWAIASGTLQTASTSAVATNATTHPDSSLNYLAQATITAANEGDVAGVIVGYVDASNYYFATLTWGAAGGLGTLTIWKRSGGTNTYLNYTSVSCGAGDTRTLRVCCGPAGIIASVTVGDYVTVAGSDITDVAASATCGLITNWIASAVTFDDFTLHYHGNDVEGCPTCSCDCTFCTDGDAPDQMRVTLAGIATANCASCGDLNGTYIAQHLCYDPLGGDLCYWLYTFPEEICGVKYLRVARINRGGIFGVVTQVTLESAGGGGFAFWMETNTPSTIDCMTIDADLALQPLYSWSDCTTYPSSTCHLESLA